MFSAVVVIDTVLRIFKYTETNLRQMILKQDSDES
jgi:hypothetical protein